MSPSPRDSYTEGDVCLLHARELAEVRGDVQGVKSVVAELKQDRDRDSGIVRDIRDRLVRVETRLEMISVTLTKQTDRTQDAFFKYGWPIILIVLTATATYYAQK